MAQTPARNVPGGFFQTPAPNRPIFRRQTPPGPRSSSNSRQPVSQADRDPEVPPIIRAANTINETLLKEASFPDLDSYVTRK